MSKFTHYMYALLASASVSGIAHADIAREDEALARAIHVLDSVKPLLNEAQAQHDNRDRMTFDYDALRDDLEKVKAGINRKFEANRLEPHVVIPIKGDYLVLKSKQKENRS